MSWGVTTVGFAKIEVIPAPADTVKFSACMFLPWSRLDSLEDMIVHELNEGKRVNICFLARVFKSCQLLRHSSTKEFDECCNSNQASFIRASYIGSK